MCPVSRAAIGTPEAVCLNRGRKANADVWKVETPDGAWVVKDFQKCPWWIRWTYGRFMAWNEYRLLKRLHGINGVPQQIYRLDAYAVVMEFLNGQTLSGYRARITPEYFLRLEAIVKAMNARGVAHLDTRNAKNVLILADGQPALLDFQAGVMLGYFPRPLQNLMIHTDLSGVYKHWYHKSRESIDDPRKDILREHFRWRRWWMLKGYAFYKRRRPKGSEQALFEEYRLKQQAAAQREQEALNAAAAAQADRRSALEEPLRP